MNDKDRQIRKATAVIAWSVSTAAGVATAVASLLPGDFGGQAFEVLRLATVLYAIVGTWEFAAARAVAGDVETARTVRRFFPERELAKA